MPFKKTVAKGQQQPIDAKNIFIGRTHELHFYIHQILQPEDPTHNLLSISGQGGVGKSTLINRFVAEAHATNFKDYCLTALVNERQPTPASIMEHFADQFREAGQPLKKFEEALTRYKEALRRMQAGSRDEQEILWREGVDLVGEMAEDIPFAGKALHRGASTVTELVLDKRRTHQYLKDAARLEDPIGDLTQAFVKDLNQIADVQVSVGTQSIKRQRRVLLCFDTFEHLASDAAPWLLDHLLEADISTNIVLIIAGRDSIENTTPEDPKRWLPYLDNQDIYFISLDSFTEEETHVYLKERGITDTAQIAQIWQLSHGLPLYLGLLTANPQGKVDPNANVVANFLRWIPEQEVLKRRLALDAALFSMPFNQDDLSAFDYTERQRANFFEWLISQPFVRSSGSDGRYMYHELAQELFGRHLRQRSPDEYYTTREALAHYYQWHIEKIEKVSKEDCYSTAVWQDLALALAQQLFLLTNGERYLKGIECIIKVYEFTGQEDELLKTLRDIARGLSGSQASSGSQKIAEELLRYCNAATKNQENIEAASLLLEKLGDIATVPAEVRAYLYRSRARSYRELKQYQGALSDFNRALTLLPSYGRAYSGRGRT